MIKSNKIFWATKKVEFTEPWDGIPRYTICGSGYCIHGEGQKYDLENFKDMNIRVYENDNK